MIKQVVGIHSMDGVKVVTVVSGSKDGFGLLICEYKFAIVRRTERGY